MEVQAPWAGHQRWQVLATAFDQGQDFLRTWQAWRDDPLRPHQLFFTALVTPDEAAEAAAGAPDFGHLGSDNHHFGPSHPLTQALLEQCQGLLPGTHRLVFEAGLVQLTLCVGCVNEVLPTLDSVVDQVLLAPPTNNTVWDCKLIKGLGRLCRHGTQLCAATGGAAADAALRASLVSAGFVLETPQPASDKPAVLARYAPHWPLRHAHRAARVDGPGRVVVVGAGLAGSAVAWSLAQRGWQVEVLDQADTAATGASALPAGVIAPHASPDDALLSRMSRTGVRLTLQRAAQLLQRDVDWAPSGVLEHRVEGKRGLPNTEAWAQAGVAWSRPAQACELQAAHLPHDTPALWHSMAGWIRPARLVRAQLQHPAVTWRGHSAVHRLQRNGAVWQLLDDQGHTLACAEHVVLATAYATRALLEDHTSSRLPLNPLRGQVSWGPLSTLPATARALLPPFPVNGHGSFVSGMHGPNTPEAMWLAGSTFERGETQALLKPEDQAANLVKLARLLPKLGTAVSPAFDQAHMWAGVRCTLPDRLPAVGPVYHSTWPGLYVCTGLGARGLTLSVLCGEVLAAWLHGEPWPAEKKLAQALLAERFWPQSP